MAYTNTIADIKRRARQRADAEGSAFFSEQEMLDMINESYANFYDLLVSAYGENYFVSTSTVTIVGGTDTYNLPTDFYKLIGIDWKVNTTQYVTLFPFMESERNVTFTGTQNIPSGEVRLRYIPVPTKYTSDSQTINSYAGWDTIIVTDVACMMLEKEESDTTMLKKRKDEAVRRILEMAENRDVGQPGRVTDVYQTDLNRLFTSIRYRMYGDQVRFVSTELLGSGLIGVQI